MRYFNLAKGKASVRGILQRIYLTEKGEMVV